MESVIYDTVADAGQHVYDSVFQDTPTTVEENVNAEENLTDRPSEETASTIDDSQKEMTAGEEDSTIFKQVR